MIERSYLSWVSGEQYAAPETFTREACQRGVTLRLCNPSMACEIAKSNTVIYLAHNRQGQESKVCHACSEVVTCPECHGRGLARGVECSRCLDHGVIEVGTGGWAQVDGVRWHYTQYIRLRRLPSHPFWKEKHVIGKIAPCKECGGRGRVPLGAVFAAVIPKDVIMITKDGRRPRLELQMTREIEVISEKDARKKWPRPKRQRMVGGLWAIVESGGDPPELANEITGALNGQARVHGGYLELLEPVMIRDKQFMALKRWVHPKIDLTVR